MGGRVSVRGEKGWSLATVYVWSTARSRTGGRRARAGARVGGRGGRSPPSMYGARHGGGARAREQEWEGEGGWEGLCGRGDGWSSARRRLWSTRDARAREQEWEGEGGWEGLCGRGDGWSSARRRLWSTRDARAHIAVRAAAADAPGPGAAPCTPQRDGSGAAPSASLEPRSASSEPRPAFCPPSSESMAPRRGKDEHGVVAAWAEVGECEHHCQVSSECQVSVK